MSSTLSLPLSPATTSIPAARTAADLALGQRGRIQRVLGSDAVGHRLMEMGLVPGAQVEMRRVAPLGDPVELVVRGYLLSIRKEEARRFLIEAE